MLRINYQQKPEQWEQIAECGYAFLDKHNDGFGHWKVSLFFKFFSWVNAYINILLIVLLNYWTDNTPMFEFF